VRNVPTPPLSDAPPASVTQRIAQAAPQLTPSHRQMAEHVLAHPLQVAMLPIDELAARVGVSVATANRFARALGFDGYAAFRAELMRGFEPLLAPVERLRGNLEQPATVADVFDAALEESHRNIAATRQSLDRASCEAAVQRILAARAVYIVGFGASAWLGGLLQHALDSYCADVRMLATASGATHAARMLARSGPADLVVVISFPRYLSDSIALAHAARGRGAQLLALTDRPTSPLAPLADVVLYAQTATRYRSNCETSVLALIEALGSAVALRAPRAVELAGDMVESVAPWLHGGPAPRAAAVRIAPPTSPAPASAAWEEQQT